LLCARHTHLAPHKLVVLPQSAEPCFTTFAVSPRGGRPHLSRPDELKRRRRVDEPNTIETIFMLNSVDPHDYIELIMDSKMGVRTIDRLSSIQYHCCKHLL